MRGEPDKHGYYAKTQAEWDNHEHPATLGLIHAGLAGSFGMRVRRQETVRLIVLDFDCHALKHRDVKPASCRCEPGDLCMCGVDNPGELRKLSDADYRQQIADRVSPSVDRLRQLLPAVAFLASSTPRGVHILMLFSEEISVRKAHEICKRLAALLPLDTVEAFPKPDAEGGEGATCRLPCLGRESRLLDDDLVTRQNPTSRVADVEMLMALRRCTPADFAHLKESTRLYSPATPKKRGKNAPAAVLQRTGESLEDAELRADLGSHLWGSEYAKALLAVYERGAPDDTSYDCMRKLAFLVVAAGIAHAECLRVAKAFVELGHHRATQMQTERGRKQLLRVFRACLRYQARGVAKGEVTPGQLANQDLWRMIRGLLGRRERLIPGLRLVSTVAKAEVSAMKRAAANARWHGREAVA